VYKLTLQRGIPVRSRTTKKSADHSFELKSIPESNRFVFLGNLPTTIRESHVRELLKDVCGDPNLSRVQIVLRRCRRSKRAHAFVEFPNLTKAQKFKNRVDGKCFLGSDRIRAMIQNRGPTKSYVTVYFGNVSADAKKSHVLEDLVAYNPAWDLLPLRLNRGRAGSNTVFVDFPNESEAEEAICQFNGKDVFASTGIKAEFENKRQGCGRTTKLPASQRHSQGVQGLDVAERMGSRNAEATFKRQIYHLVKKKRQGIRLGDLKSEFESSFLGSHMGLDGNQLLKFLVKLESLLLIDTKNGDDTVLFYTEKTAFRSVLDIMHSNNPEGIPVPKFKAELEKSLNSSLDHCNVVDFLRRWRVVSIVTKDGQPTDGTYAVPEENLIVKLAPLGASTVFLGNLAESITEHDIINGLKQVKRQWSNLNIRLNHAKGVVNAFVDFPALSDAELCIRTFNKKCAFGSQFVRAEMENSTAQRASRSPARGSPQTTPQANTPRGSGGQSPSTSSPASSESMYPIRMLPVPTATRQTAVSPMQRSSMESSGSSGKKFSWSSVAKSPATSSANTPHALQFRMKPLGLSASAMGSPTRSLHVNGLPAPVISASSSIQRGRNRWSWDQANPLIERIYKLLDEHPDGIRLSELHKKYTLVYGPTGLERLLADLSPKAVTRNEARILLLNLLGSEPDSMVYLTDVPAHRLVVEIMRSPHMGEQQDMKTFTRRLESRIKADLSMCDFEDFIRRWRFIWKEGAKDGSKRIHFTPHAGSTVFFGNLNKATTAEDIFQGLVKYNPNWRNASVRLKTGKAGFNYAFVDFKSRQDAEKAVDIFDGKAAFKSKYVSADIEQASLVRPAVEQIKGTREPHTVFIGNLPCSVTKTDIQRTLLEIDETWSDNPIRLNLRNGWSHAFVDFSRLADANEAIHYLKGKAQLGSMRLRAELSKNNLRRGMQVSSRH